MADLQALLDGIPAVAAYGLRVEAADDGVVMAAQLGPDAAAYQGEATAHGGVIASVLDTAATFAMVAATGSRWVTVDLRVDYLRPTALGALSCETRVVSQGRRIGVVQAEAKDGDGRTTVLAIATMSRVGGDERG